jgi:hypothetical protein
MRLVIIDQSWESGSTYLVQFAGVEKTHGQILCDQRPVRSSTVFLERTPLGCRIVIPTIRHAEERLQQGCPFGIMSVAENPLGCINITDP